MTPALARLAEVWDALGDEAEARYQQLARSRFAHDLDRNIDWLADRMARKGDQVRGALAQLW